MTFPELTQLALIGTERQAVPPVTGDAPLSTLLAQLDLNQREESLLSAAALMSLYATGGRLSARDTGALPAVCAAEEPPYMSELAGSLVQRLLNAELPELLSECLALAAQAGQVALPETLPGWLNLGVRDAARREMILPVLGQRGRWLATQNSEWAWVTGAQEDETLWQVGISATRVLFLQRLRRVNPARARELLATTWATETPEDRLKFITVWEIGLSPDDEPFLESALNDKRKEIRQMAARWLARLPDSALVRRMIERVQPLLKFIPAESGNLLKLKKSRPASLEVSLPMACDAAMQRDGVEMKIQGAWGEKMGWLIQMLETVPLNFWTTTWCVPPAEILAASSSGEWRKELFEAWSRAAIRQQNISWAEALFATALTSGPADKLGSLLAVLPPSQREHHVMLLLNSADPKQRDLQVDLISQCRHGWSLEFSHTILNWLRQITAAPPTVSPMQHQLKEFAARLAPSILSETSTGWPSEAADWDFWSRRIDEFLAVTRFRSDLHTAFATTPTDPTL